jgi:hypothetical protein
VSFIIPHQISSTLYAITHYLFGWIICHCDYLLTVVFYVEKYLLPKIQALQHLFTAGVATRQHIINEPTSGKLGNFDQVNEIMRQHNACHAMKKSHGNAGECQHHLATMQQLDCHSFCNPVPPTRQSPRARCLSFYQFQMRSVPPD